MDDLDKEVHELFSGIAKMHGMDDLSATLYSIIYLEPEAQTLDELSKKTGYSLASISSKIKMMERFGVVKKLHRAGSKKIYVTMEKNVLKATHERFSKMLDMKISLVKTKLPDIIKTHKGKGNEAKIKILEDYYKQLGKLETIFKETIERLKHA